MYTKVDRALRDVFTAKLERLINDSDKSQVKLAEELGYDNQNMITMIKQGKTRVPPQNQPPLRPGFPPGGRSPYQIRELQQRQQQMHPQPEPPQPQQN